MTPPLTAPPAPPFTRKEIGVSFLAALLYGVVLRAVIELGLWEDGLIVMSFAYIVAVPIIVGFLAVRRHPNPGWGYALFFPWVAVWGITLVTAIAGYEGAICIVMAFPLLGVSGSVGGAIAKLASDRTRGYVGAAMLLPFAVGIVESRLPRPYDVHTVTNSIDIAASPATVWREIVSVREIQREEMPGNPLFLRMGFPRPLSAEIDREEVGGIRKARFAGGVLFLETVTELEPERLLSFAIAAQTDSIPPGTLDDHVTIGGPYFDVLQGTYRIEPLGTDSVRLHLESRLRVSTHFNWYASGWADLVMASIQRNILVVERVRAEGAHSR